MIVLKKVLVLLVIVVSIYVVLVVSHNIAVKVPHNVRPEESVNWLESNQYYESDLRLGMSKQEVAGLVPVPHNADTEVVWIWLKNFPDKSEKNERIGWKDIHIVWEGGFFIVFTNDKLATPLCSSAAFAPVSALQKYSGLNRIQADEILNCTNKQK